MHQNTRVVREINIFKEKQINLGMYFSKFQIWNKSHLIQIIYIRIDIHKINIYILYKICPPTWMISQYPPLTKINDDPGSRQILLYYCSFCWYWPNQFNYRVLLYHIAACIAIIDIYFKSIQRKSWLFQFYLESPKYHL